MEKPNDMMNIAVIGAGLAGLTAAFAMAKQGHTVTVCAPKSLRQDGRSTALMSGSIDYLTDLGIWEEIQSKAFPLKTMRIIDDTRRLIRAPQIDFVSSEIDLEAFGYNILNVDMIDLLENKLKSFKNVTFIEKPVAQITYLENKSSKIQLDDKTEIDADLIIAADGRNSFVRNSLNIEVTKTRYPQIAVVANLSHTLPHNNISTEFHTPTGPFTLVPSSNPSTGENISSLVAVEDQQGAEDLHALEKIELELELERRMHSILGKVKLISKLQSFPLGSLVAHQFGAKNVVLIGEAAHALPPIGAQGLNLGMRDIKTVAQLLAKNLKPFQISEKYHQERKLDIKTRMTSVDLLNRSLLSDFLPTQITRSFGLYTLSNFAPLRRLAMNEGIAPGRSLSKFFTNASALFSK
ncbi:MAG: UbiH/UbiF family hydroxylase [Rhizobiales bacterium]|nr:UbiH/UbiF family hydroxylase [Hyphomicrobiales bacterium]